METWWIILHCFFCGFLHLLNLFEDCRPSQECYRCRVRAQTRQSPKNAKRKHKSLLISSGFKSVCFKSQGRLIFSILLCEELKQPFVKATCPMPFFVDKHLDIQLSPPRMIFLCQILIWNNWGFFLSKRSVLKIIQSNIWEDGPALVFSVSMNTGSVSQVCFQYNFTWHAITTENAIHCPLLALSLWFFLHPGIWHSFDFSGIKSGQIIIFHGSLGRISLFQIWNKVRSQKSRNSKWGRIVMFFSNNWKSNSLPSKWSKFGDSEKCQWSEAPKSHPKRCAFISKEQNPTVFKNCQTTESVSQKDIPSRSKWSEADKRSPTTYISNAPNELIMRLGGLIPEKQFWLERTL